MPTDKGSEQIPPMSMLAGEALRHWKTYRPTAYGLLEDPAAFFENLAQRAREQMQDAEYDYVQARWIPEYATDVMALMDLENEARAVAREMVLPQMLFLPAEPGLAGDDE